MSFIRTFINKTAALVLCLVLFSACAGEPEDKPIIIPGDAGTKPTEAPVNKTGGALRIPMPQNPKTMHPLYIKEAQLRNVYSIIFEPLVSFNELMEPTQCLAENWRYDAVNNVWTVNLRANVHWHNKQGHVTGTDAAYTLNTIISDPESIYYAQLFPYVQRAEGYDNTLLIYPKNPSYALIYALNIPIIPAAYYQARAKDTRDPPVGSGCFQVQEMTFGEGTRMVMNVFTDWWKKLPYLEQVVATGYADTDSMLQAFKQGDVDCVPTSLMTIETYEILEGVNEKNYLSHNYVFIAFNLTREFMKDVDFRRAIAYGIDRTGIINNVYLTKASGAEQPLFNDTSISSAKVTRYDHDGIKAKEILGSMGYWDHNGDGYLDFQDKTVEVSLAVLNEPSSPVRLMTAEYIRDDLKEIGIKVNINALPLQELKAAIEKKDYDIILSGYYLSDTPDLDFAFSSGGSGNLSGYASAEADAALYAMKNASSLEALKNAALSLQNVLARDLSQIGLFFTMNTFLYTDRLNVGTIQRDTSVYSTINTWYYK